METPEQHAEMGRRKPRLSGVERVLSRADFMSDESKRRYANDHEMCPDHLRSLPCFKCAEGSP